jgi:hypothetical protein
VYWGGNGFDFNRETGCPDVEDSGLPAYDAASLAEGCRKFRRNILPPLSGVMFFVVQLELEKEGIIVLPRAGNSSPSYTA